MMLFSSSLLLILSLFTPVFSFSAFSSFQFAPNGVCTCPRYFVCNDTRFTMKNVPGEGDCMFLAVTLASLCSVGLGANNVLLNSISRETRQVVANVLCLPQGNLVIQGKRLVSTCTLLRSAAKKESVSTDEYITRLRDGRLYGGGPELTVLSNILRRPISIYELVLKSDGTTAEDVQPIECKGIFASPTFQDPLLQIPDSAILANNDDMPGAYSWHLHILVVDTSENEKHACVLLPLPS